MVDCADVGDRVVVAAVVGCAVVGAAPRHVQLR
jgi:hypothetical protein